MNKKFGPVFVLLVGLGFPACAQDCEPVLLAERNSNVAVVKASEEDFSSIIKIGNQHRNEMGQILKHNLRVGIAEQSLLVAKDSSGQTVGFILWHQRKDGWNTIYDVGVEKSHLGAGVGKALILRVPRPRQLKAVEDNWRSHKFYLSAGMAVAGTAQSRRGRKLLIFRDSVEPVE